MRKIQIAGYGLESAEIENQEEVIVQDGEALDEATEALEAFALLLQPATEGASVDPRTLNLVASVTNRLVVRAKLPQLSVGCESVAVDTVQQAASLGLEDIKEHLKNAMTAAKEFLLKIFKWIAEKFKSLGASAEKIAGSLKKTLEKFKSKSGTESIKLVPKKEGDKTLLAVEGPGIDKDVKIECDVRNFYINGKLSGDLAKTLNSMIDQIWLNGASISEVNDAIREVDSALEKEEGENWLQIRNKFNKDLKDAAKRAYGLDENGELKNGLGRRKVTLKINTAIESPTEPAIETDNEGYPEATQSLQLKDLGLDQSTVTQMIAHLEKMEQYAGGKMLSMIKSADGISSENLKMSNHSQNSKDDPESVWMRQHLRVVSATWRDIYKYRVFDSHVIMNMLGTMRELNKLLAAIPSA